MKILENKFLRQISSVYLARFSGVAFGLLTTIITTKNVGPEGRGWMACAFTLANFWCAVGAFGINISNLVLGAKWTDKKSELTGNSLAISCLSSAVLAFLLYLSDMLFPGSVPLPGVFWWGTIFYTLSLSVYINLQSLLIAFGQVKICNLQEFFYKFGILAATLALCWLNMKTPGKFFSAAAFIIFTASLWVIYAAARSIGGRIKLSWETFKNSASFNLKSFVYTIFNNIYLMADVFLVQHIAGPAQTGLYNIALAVRGVLFMVTTIVCQLMLPKTAESCRTIRDSIPGITRTANILTLANILLASASALIIPKVIDLLLGDEFAPSAVMLCWLLPGIVLFANYSVYTLIYNLAGQPWNSAFYLAAASFIDLALCVPFIQANGAVGAAQAFSCASLFLASTAWYQAYLYKHKDIGLQEIAKR